jgi:hypothetical protein
LLKTQSGLALNETGVHLLSGVVWTLASLPVVLGSVEGHEGVALALLVVHLKFEKTNYPSKLILHQMNYQLSLNTGFT